MPRATTSVSGIAIHPDQPILSRNQAITKAIAVEMVISTLSSILREENAPIGR
ncbi:hypothetical protein KIM372_07930 [Bombiscardovia nodaiensis]|uniref:Uncharacterized protein n=1 Tax=Bombiscardovia nodaiensis TaxID=2932181 RepID=A0ABN6S9P5_9BIFI|nr:hypothetical protein KIM372_07930 [Bombiscardovia nodaiensis]